MENIRNFCIIAHIDHGKSTLADRLIEKTDIVSRRGMKDQLLDQMDIERERGITIKLQPVRMKYKDYEFNLIDTPGHVDFTYEVSRSLAAVEGALLLVDATQGVQAQTLANLYLAMEQDLTIIPIINKIDLPNSQVDKVSKEIVDLLGCVKEDIINVSAKTGEGVEDVLAMIADKIPAPKVDTKADTRALIFDSIYDEYKGVIAYIRVFDGEIKAGDEIRFVSNGQMADSLEVGFLSPQFNKTPTISSGEVGYIITGLRDVSQCQVGDTITIGKSKVEPLMGYQDVKPMVYAGIYCKEGSEFERLREAIEKLKLNDAALDYEPENSQVLGFGFRCGFLGLLHLEVFQERLKREFNLELVVTIPSVAFQVYFNDGKVKTIYNPVEYPDPTFIDHVEEPIMKLDIFTPQEYLGAVMQLATEKRGEYINTEYLDKDTAILHYTIPLTQLIVDFYDKLKSVSSGYASLSYDFDSYRKADVVKMDILVAEEKVEALSLITYKDSVFSVGKGIVNTLKESLPRQQFVIKLQAAVGGKVIAGGRISALRKDVTAKLYGGDYSRRQKLLEKQKKGKKKMMAMGKVDIPTDVFLKVLKK
jgi:GTP-binding protein LepA